MVWTHLAGLIVCSAGSITWLTTALLYVSVGWSSGLKVLIYIYMIPPTRCALLSSERLVLFCTHAFIYTWHVGLCSADGNRASSTTCRACEGERQTQVERPCSYRGVMRWQAMSFCWSHLVKTWQKQTWPFLDLRFRCRCIRTLQYY